ncbi:transcriptional repressor [Candidatus Gottesmanbacteria bacterium]|nr:transcriptional repressor [Candidatus Gottesmanbacteria bacterium]
MQKDIINTLRQSGFRFTPQRAIILEIIQRKKRHMKISEIVKEIKAIQPYINISTIYRTLSFLTQTGLITELQTQEGTEYEYEEAGQHQHLICKKCNKSREIHAETFNRLETEIKEKYNFYLDLKHIPMYGFCSKCLKKLH